MKHLFIVAALCVFSISAFGQIDNKDSENKSKPSGMVSISGKTFGSAELDGKVVVMNFWYSSCPPCLKEIPELNKLVEEYKGKDVVFLGLATDGKASLEKFLKEHPFNYEIIPNATQMMFKFLEPEPDGTLETKFPTHIVMNREGKRTVYATGIKGIEVVKKELAFQFQNDEPVKMAKPH